MKDKLRNTPPVKPVGQVKVGDFVGYRREVLEVTGKKPAGDKIELAFKGSAETAGRGGLRVEFHPSARLMVVGKGYDPDQFVFDENYHWTRNVRDAADKVKEEYRAIISPNGACGVAYQIAVLGEDRVAVRYDVKNGSEGRSSPWSEYGSRAEAIGVVVREARAMFANRYNHFNDYTPAGERSGRRDMVDKLQPGLFGDFVEPPPVTAALKKRMTCHLLCRWKDS